MRHLIKSTFFSALIVASLATPRYTRFRRGLRPGVVDQGNCVCVPYYQCNEKDTVITDEVRIFDVRLSGKSDAASMQNVRPRCKGYLNVCCKSADAGVEPGPWTRTPVSGKGCGRSNPGGVGSRILGNGDAETQFGEFPWMVAIFRKESVAKNYGTVDDYQCGGSLIHPKAVMTAAHCVKGKLPSGLKIRAGEWDTQTRSEVLSYQDRDVDDVIVHEDFDSGALHNDVAILILKTGVNLAGNVGLICLPKRGEIFDGNRCLASGWGKDKFGTDGQRHVILRKTDLPIVPHGVCQDSLRLSRLGKYFNLDPSFICAGGETGRDTCQGDGGGPLVCPLKNDPSRYAQVGIVAWGIGCGRNGLPGVYANVAYLRQWIDEKMNNHYLGSSIYQA